MIVRFENTLKTSFLPQMYFSADAGEGEGLRGGVDAAESETGSAEQDPREAVDGLVEDSEENAEPATVTIPADEYQKLIADVERYRDIALRSQADLDNYRKRMVRELEEGRRYANNDLLERILPVVDNFELGLAAAKTSPDQNIYFGMSMVQKQFTDFLDSSGLKAIPADPGSAFDPKLHEAVAQEASAEVPAGQIIRQTRRGFKLGDRLLRAANVVVSTGA